MKIYLDNAATTKPDRAVINGVIEILENCYANPASIHQGGREAFQIISQAKEKISSRLGCKSEEIYFTSGATESNNWAIISAFEMLKENGNHIVATAIEHESVIRTLEYLQKERGAKITYVNPNISGRVCAKEIEMAITKDTILICMMYVNNETGVIQPVEEVSNIAKENEILFHCDAVQALGKIEINLEKLGADTVSFSAHKIHGIKGSGLLYIKAGRKYKSFIHGGKQQNSRRAGTENPIACIAFSKALDGCFNECEKVEDIKKYFIDKLHRNIEGIQVNGDIENSVGSILNVSIDETDSEEVLISLDMEGICASAGSACTSGSIEPSYVLKAMGFSYSRNRSAIRFSFSKYTTQEEIDYTVEKLKEITDRLRSY